MSTFITKKHYCNLLNGIALVLILSSAFISGFDHWTLVYILYPIASIFAPAVAAFVFNIAQGEGKDSSDNKSELFWTGIGGFIGWLLGLLYLNLLDINGFEWQILVIGLTILGLSYYLWRAKNKV